MELKNKLGILAILLIFNTVFLLGSVLAYDTGDVVVAWSFDDDASTTAIDDHRGLANGTYTGATTTAYSVIGNSVYFDGTNDKILWSALTGVPTDFNLGSNDWSLSYWLSANATTGAMFTGTIVGCGGDSYQYWSANNLRIAYDGEYDTTSWSPTLNTWYHVVMTANGANNKTIYINGAKNTELANSGTWNLECYMEDAGAGNSFSMGEEEGGGNDWHGHLDEVVLFNKTLTQAEITSLYNSGSGDAYPFTPVSTNITVQAISSYNSVAIANYNVTGRWGLVNGGGTITTDDIINGTIYSQNLSAKGFSNLNNASVNTSWIGSLTPLGFSGTNTTLTHGNLYVGNDIQIDCDYTDDMQYGVGVTYWINNTDDSLLTSQAGQNYTLLGTDLNNNIQFWCELNNTYYNMNTTVRNVSGIDRTVTFRAINYLGSLISSVTFNFTSLNITNTGNPFTSFMSNFLNSTQTTLNTSLYVEDLTFYNRDFNSTVLINESIGIYNISLDPNQLVLEFYNKTAGASDTKFEIADKNGVFANSSSSVVVIQQGLTSGQVKVVFNQDDYGANWTQFYEYKNDFETHISEQLTLLNQSADWAVYFEVLDYGNSPVPEATIRAEYTEATAGQTNNYTLIGQRLSDQDGKTFFWFDSSTFVLLTITANGYTPVEKVLRIGDESASTKALAIPIYLQESTTGVDNNMWVYLPKYVNNKSENINGIILHKTADQVKYTTAYRESLGLEQVELTDDGYGRYYFTMTSGTEFSSSASGDITVYIYIDGTLTKTWTIEEKVITRIFDIPSLDDDIEVVAGAIALIFISGAIGMLFTSATAGFTTFMVGSIFMSLLNAGFLWLSAIGIIYFLLRTIRKVFME